MKSLPYNAQFFADFREAAIYSARQIAPIVMDLMRPSSLIDIGCGEGSWLLAFNECGVQQLRGVDGEYVDMSKFLLDKNCFIAADLSSDTFNIAGGYDLVLCLEVAEHLTPRNGTRLIKLLTDAAPVVLFSAAVPGQGGTNHINEQWPSYWAEQFANCGFRRLDPIRPRIRDNERIPWYYRQNIVLYASQDALLANAILRDELGKAPSEALEWVHMTPVRTYRDPRYWWKLGQQGLMRKLKRKFWQQVARTR